MMFKANLQFSKDGGRTWSDWRELDLGEVGDFNKPVVSRRFGIARTIVFRERVTDDCRADLIAASVQISPAGE